MKMGRVSHHEPLTGRLDWPSLQGRGKTEIHPGDEHRHEPLDCRNLGHPGYRLSSGPALDSGKGGGTLEGSHILGMGDTQVTQEPASGKVMPAREKVALESLSEGGLRSRCKGKGQRGAGSSWRCSLVDQDRHHRWACAEWTGKVEGSKCSGPHPQGPLRTLLLGP